MRIKPYKDDDESQQVTTWEEITKVVGVDIRHVTEKETETVE